MPVLYLASHVKVTNGLGVPPSYQELGSLVWAGGQNSVLQRRDKKGCLTLELGALAV